MCAQAPAVAGNGSGSGRPAFSARCAGGHVTSVTGTSAIDRYG